MKYLTSVLNNTFDIYDAGAPLALATRAARFIFPFDSRARSTGVLYCILLRSSFFHAFFNLLARESAFDAVPALYTLGTAPETCATPAIVARLRVDFPTDMISCSLSYTFLFQRESWLYALFSVYPLTRILRGRCSFPSSLCASGQLLFFVLSYRKYIHSVLGFSFQSRRYLYV